MRTYNRAVVIGHAGSDPVLRYTKGGKAVTNLSIATNFKRKDGPEETTWHRVVFWDRLAELVGTHVRKGTALYVEGSMSTTEWTDKDGQKKTSLEINARELILLGRSGGAPGSTPWSGQNPQQLPDGEERGEVIEDIPF